MTGRPVLHAWATLSLLAAVSGCGGPGATPAAIDDAAPAPVPPSFALKSATLTLPEERPVLPATANGALLTQNCTGCHSAEMLASQPPLDAAKWQSEIDKMRKVFHAPIAESDDPALVAALLDLQAARVR